MKIVGYIYEAGPNRRRLSPSSSVCSIPRRRGAIVDVHTVNCKNLTTEEKCPIKQASVARLVQFLFEPCLALREWTHSSFVRVQERGVEREKMFFSPDNPHRNFSTTLPTRVERCNLEMFNKTTNQNIYVD